MRVVDPVQVQVQGGKLWHSYILYSIVHDQRYINDTSTYIFEDRDIRWKCISGIKSNY